MPSQYVATQMIDLDDGFQSGDSTDVLTAYIADTTYAGTGNGGSDASGVAGQGKYRYGFNGKEQDNEVKGIGDQIDYGMRIYDPRVGRFLSVDPIGKKYPELTPFQFASNRPIDGADLDGKEWDLRTTVPRNIQAHIQQIQATKDAIKQRNREYDLLAMKNESTISSARMPNGPLAQQLKQDYTIQRYQEVGLNDDGTKPPLMRLAENKTWKNFAENIALPLLDAAALYDGAGEIKTLFQKGVSFLGRNEFEILAKSGTIDAKTIRFSQNSISANFKNGADVETLINQLKSGQKINIEPIRIVQKDNMVFTLDNRRLYAYQQAGVEVPYLKLDKIPEDELFKFSTTNNGESIEVRKPKTINSQPNYRHP